MLIVTYDNSDKDVPCICVMKVGKSLSYACLKMELGEQAELLYRALTEQDFRIKENKRDTLVGKDVLVGFKQGVNNIRTLSSGTPQEPRWIPVSERLPKAGEYVGNVEKYYLVQNEYGDMMVARYTHSEYWEQIYQLNPIADEIIAWRELPQPYKADRSVE